MKKVSVFLVLVFFGISFFLTTSALAEDGLLGNYGDFMLLYAPGPITDPVGAKAERDVREYEETLLNLGIPQYLALAGSYKRVRDESLARGELFYHTEICDHAHIFKDEKGMTWRRYRFTDLALQIGIDVDQVVSVELWIARKNEGKFKLPFSETRQLYRRYIEGDFDKKHVPIELMIGTEYGQSLEDYTNFADFYSSFMNKHHYCVTVCFWAVIKSLYDNGSEAYKKEVEDLLKDPQRVQSFDTLTAGRLVGMLLDFGLIEEY